MELTEREKKVFTNILERANKENKKPSCPVCKELEMTFDKTTVTQLYETGTGYFSPIEDIVVRYCPSCGRKLNKEV